MPTSEMAQVHESDAGRSCGERCGDDDVCRDRSRPTV